ncbi:hypothetical protein QBC43DRAFT_50202 [Cladorrhinum sp. PSN259]|nr:hypothetical protein QBC43DRAFT_50202 [Cladorrhinum sp. PSN259]
MIAQSFIMFTFLISLATAWQSSSTCDISKATVQRSPSTNSYDGTACNNIKETLLSHHHSIFFDSVPPSDIFMYGIPPNQSIPFDSTN